MSKKLEDLTDEELAAEHLRWAEYLANATGWGSALTAAAEFRRACETEMLKRKRNRPVKVTSVLSRIGFTPTHQHVARGTFYEAIAVAKMQIHRRGRGDFPATAAVLGDGDEVVVYRDRDGNVYVRELGEFNDGRFSEG